MRRDQRTDAELAGSWNRAQSGSEPGKSLEGNIIYCEELDLGRESSFRVRVCLGARQHVQS